MRPADRNSFKNGAPLLASWSTPTVTKLHLTKDELAAIVASNDPQAELRKVYARSRLSDGSST